MDLGYSKGIKDEPAPTRKSPLILKSKLAESCEALCANVFPIVQGYPSPYREFPRGWQGIEGVTPWSKPIPREEIESLKVKIEKLTKIVQYQEGVIVGLQTQNRKILQEIGDLKQIIQSKKMIENLWDISDKNIKIIEEIFDLDEIVVEHPQNAISELKGILKDCIEEGIDSVEIVRSLREG